MKNIFRAAHLYIYINTYNCPYILKHRYVCKYKIVIIMIQSKRFILYNIMQCLVVNCMRESCRIRNMGH